MSLTILNVARAASVLRVLNIFSQVLAAYVTDALVDGLPDDHRTVSPFSQHMKKYFKQPPGQVTRTEVIENMHLSLESLGEELQMVVPGSSVSSKVDRVELTDSMLIHGHLTWEVDNPTPEVYDITMDLLKDGFVFRADTKSFVITSRVAK
jgi:hypothetical protein